MVQANVAQDKMNRNNPKYLSFETHVCPDCGVNCEHGLYQQCYPRISKLLIIEDCFSCLNTRTVKAFRDGIEVAVKNTNKQVVENPPK